MPRPVRRCLSAAARRSPSFSPPARSTWAAAAASRCSAAMSWAPTPWPSSCARPATITRSRRSCCASTAREVRPSPPTSSCAKPNCWPRKKPLVISMSDLAASGGYWISLSAQKIFAQPETITGSIGVISGKFVLKGLYDKIGHQQGDRQDLGIRRHVFRLPAVLRAGKAEGHGRHAAHLRRVPEKSGRQPQNGRGRRGQDRPRPGVERTGGTEACAWSTAWAA